MELSHLMKSIKDDVKDIKMLCGYAEEAFEKGDHRLAQHYIQKILMRKGAMEQSHALAVMLLNGMEDHRTEREKALHTCLHDVLMDDMKQVEHTIASMQHLL